MRTTILSALILASCFEGHAWAESLCSGKSKEVAWKQLQTTPVKSPDDMRRNDEAFLKECGLPLVFWAGPEAEPSQKADHPCGEVVQAFVQTMPPPTDPVAQSEEVFELGPDGKVTQRWRVPVNAVIKGTVGRELIVLADLGMESPSLAYLAIDPEGKIRVVHDKYEFQRTPIPCPASQDLPRSAYLGCWQLTETSSGPGRQFAYEGPCT